MRASQAAIFVAITSLCLTDCKCTPPTPSPIACNALTQCPGMQPARVCISNCAGIATAGQPCSADPCIPNATVCDSNTTCVVNPPGPTGVCQPLGYRGALAVCTPGDLTQPCAPGLFCHDVTKYQPNCAPVTPDNPQPFPMSYCAAARMEGQKCDSKIDSPTCMPCDVGLDCVEGTCQRHCTGDPGCPCSGWGCFGTGAPVCYQCATGGVGTDCHATGQCCDHKLSCGAGGTCCLPNGAACTARTDCCGSACIAGKCVSCTPPNQSPTTGSGDQCCPPEGFRSGTCFLPCPQQVGEPCKVTNFNGPVFGQCQNGTVTSCDNFGHNVCTPGKPSPETCNHLDDDCDGKVDNLTGTCMTQAPGGCNVTGHNACGSVNGSYGQICSVVAGVDYCTSCGQTVQGASCGACAGQQCFGSNNCVPNTLCDSPPGHLTCNPQTGCPQQVSCWLPSNLSYNRSVCFSPNATGGGGGGSGGSGGGGGGP